MKPIETETEATLRRALTARADAVEPRATDFAAVEARTDALRPAATRRHAVLAAAAAVLIAVGLVGVLTVGDGGDDDRTDVATDTADTADTADTTPAAIAGPDPGVATAIWPLPTMSIAYGDPTDAALAFVENYLGFTGALCAKAPEVAGEQATVDVLHDGVCGGGIGGAPNEPFGPTTTVALRHTAHGWAVVGATSGAFVARPRGTDVAISATIPLSAPLTVQVRAVGRVDVVGEQTTAPPATVGEQVVVTVPELDQGPAVLIVSDGLTASAMVIT